MNIDVKDAPIVAEPPNGGPSPTHRIPELFLIGAAKSATSSLANALAQHPQIGLGRIKEPNFFSHRASYARGFDWYSSLYAHLGPHQFALDASTGYTRWPQNPGTPARIHACAPDAKLIYLMRHPVDRAYSHFVHRWSKERFPNTAFSMTFEDYVELDPMCVDSSNYRAQIKAYLEYFPRESLLCLFTDDLKQNPVAVLQQICQFIGVDASAVDSQTGSWRDNQARDFLEGRVRVALTNQIKSVPVVKPLLPYVPQSVRHSLYRLIRRTRLGADAEQSFTPPPMTDSVRQQMIDRFAESNAWVEQFTGRDLANWYR